ncbi:GntR family transcriptional regulator [Flavobacterium akiainvivens]|uniref:GntR family transcriptional regulator n=1 Tax=Flavobacterium akiainvivens TaxID=1202724 RepID=A0A0M9VHL7_9FLAO|nr:PLP-dependent aminotransferase family protein [Flavobacterium akiainvivens]KOS05690.1 GntR family transcriptional regulator [Flavobacterium akiainvivens]SFQ36718.1 GntR family transcriptional regulator / MocR family aminotransferase [Flavobacterium akiainvivens]
MSSPVKIPFKSFISLKPQEPTALYLQIVFEFIKAIQTGLLPEGTKLPGTRILCKLLSVNRNTLIKALQDLELQGWIEIQPNKGAFVLSQVKKNPRAESAMANPAASPGFEFSRSAILEDPTEASKLPLAFNDGLPDVRLLQTTAITRLYVSKLKRNSGTMGLHNTVATHLAFKQHFSNYLNLTRGLRIPAANLLTTNSHEISLYLVTRVLLSKGDKVVVASPGYYRPNMTLLDSGAQIITIPVDAAGINTTALKKVCKEHKIKALYLTSNYHYPTTAVLSAKRRMELPELANSYGFVIIEDDYDFDFHYDNNPVLPLAAFDTAGKVVYIGSFGRSLPPGFGYGFVTGPPAFIAELQKHRNIMEHEPDVVKEQVITEWIKEGEVHRLSKKNTKLYKERRDYFVKLLAGKLKGEIKFKIPPRGLAVWVEWQGDISLMRLKRECAARGLLLPNIILYQSKNLTATRLGFGHLDIDEMEKAAAVLSESYYALLHQNDND